MSQNSNFLYPTGFVLKLSKIPNVEFAVQTVNIPSITLGSIQRPTPGFVRLKEFGNVQYSQLALTFLVQADLTNYKELVNWMTELGHPTDYNETDRTEYDGTIVVLNNRNKTCGAQELKFTKIFPVSLGEINLDITNADPEPAVASVVFDFNTMHYL